MRGALWLGRGLFCGVALLLASSCSSDELFVAFPRSAELGAALVFGEAGQVESSTPISRLDDGSLTFSVDASSAERVAVVGYSRSALESVGWSDAISEPKDPIRIRQAEDAALPEPIYYGQLSSASGFSVLEEPTETLPDLTADWVEGCPHLGPLVVQIGCLKESCAPEMSQSGCIITADEGGICGLGPIHLRIDRSGAFVEGGSERLAECEADAREGAVLAMSCQDTLDQIACPVELDPSDSAPPVEFQRRVQLTDVEPLGDQKDYFLGPAVIHQEEILATVYDVPTRFDCETEAQSHIVRLDKTSLSITGTIATPPCLTQLVSEGDRLLATYGWPERVLASMDSAGRELKRVSLPDVSMIPRLMRLGGTVRTRIYMLARTSRAPELFAVFAFDAETLELLAQSEEVEGNVSDLLVVDDRVVTMVDEVDQARFYSLDSLNVLGFVNLSPTELFTNQVTAMFYHPDSERFVGLIGGRFAGMVFFDSTEQRGRLMELQRDFITPATAGIWPARPEFFITALKQRGSLAPSVIRLVDPVQGRFVVGSQTAPVDGPIEALIADPGSDRIFALHPTTGYLTEITPPKQ